MTTACFLLPLAACMSPQSLAERRQDIFANLKTVVVKVGTRILTNDDNSLSDASMVHLADQIALLQDRGLAVVLVTSGAVGLGMGVLGYTLRPTELAEKQACAAIGQIRLMNRYADLFGAKGKVVAQILLSADDFRDNTRFNNIRHTVSTLLAKGVLPIINENDTITTDEIKVGDNDKLSADVAHFLEADLLVILSDEEGLFDKNPKSHRDARKLDLVERITPDIMALAEEGTGSRVSVGGMKAKLTAIRQATEAGTPTVLARGWRVPLLDIVQGASHGTLFLPKPTRIKRQKRWLAYVSRARGQLVLDEGGVKAVKTGRVSLLPAGIKEVKGRFQPGDLVEVLAPDGEILGRGRTAYGAEEVAKIKGLKSGRIAEILGRKGPDEVIHRDNLAVFGD
jgi:glutamate 5-kinase